MKYSSCFARAVAPVAMLAVSALPFQASADPAGTIVAQPTSIKNAIPSKLIPDENGVLWFQKGTDGNTAISMGTGLSDRSDGFAVIVLTSDKYAEKAVAHAVKLASWFEQQPEIPNHVPVVVKKEGEGVGYMYSTDGFPYHHDELAPAGVMSPREAAALRKDAVLSYQATRIVRERHERTAVASITPP